MKKGLVSFLVFVLSLTLGLGLTLPTAAQEGSAPGGVEAVVVEESIELEEPQDGVEASDERRTLREWFDYGGNVMWLLVIVSAFSVTLVLERSWRLRRGAVIPRKFLQQVRAHWERREISELLRLCAASETAIARTLRAGLLHFEDGLARMEDAIDTAGDHEATLLRRNMPLLAALGNIATMLGLLGTVLGMIESFDLIAQTGTGDARVVAGGIFQALVTTAAGLGVGIFAVAMHSYLRRKIDVLVIDLEEISFRWVEELTVSGSEVPEPGPAPGGKELAESRA